MELFNSSALTKEDFILIALLIIALQLLTMAVLYAIEAIQNGFDKKYITNYGVTVIVVLIGSIYNQQLIALVTNPPLYVFLIPVVWYGFFLIYNLNKDKFEVTLLMTNTKIQELLNELKASNNDIKALERSVGILEDNYESSLDTINDVRQNVEIIAGNYQRMTNILNSTEEE